MASFTDEQVVDKNIDEVFADEQKTLGNNCFVSGNYEQALLYYTKALEHSKQNQVILLTNRAAAYLGLKDYEKAAKDADAAIALDPIWLKAYYRKANAHEGQERLDLVYYTWQKALANCEKTSTLNKQYITIEKRWRKLIRHPSHIVHDASDLLQRFALLTDQRERLSTLAHFWNDASLDERFAYFQMLFEVLGHTREMEDNPLLCPEHMTPLPLENYPDYPHAHLAHWHAFFAALPLEEKKSLFKEIWGALSRAEQGAVVGDMKLFLSETSVQEEKSGDEVPSSSSSQAGNEENECDGIDFSYRKHFGGKKTS